MIRFFALLPLITFGLYWLYLYKHGYSDKQGKKGFLVIFWFNFVILGFFTLMYFLTRIE